MIWPIESCNDRPTIDRPLPSADVAEAIGVSRKTISTIEVGRFVPSTIIAQKIARYFDVPLEDIFFPNDAG